MSDDTDTPSSSVLDSSSPPSFTKESDAEKQSTESKDNHSFKPPPPSEAPDGGLQAWLMLAGAWCVLFCTFGWINSIGIFQQYYEDDLLSQYSSSIIAWIPSLQVFFMFAMGPLVGQLFDRFGPRYLLIIGSFLHVFGLMMTSLSTKYYQVLLSQGFCSAIGVALISQPTLSCIPSWFAKKRGSAYGIAATGSSIGGVVFPIMVERLISDLGFGWSMRIAAFLILALLIIANLTVRSRVPPNPRRMTKEEALQPFKDLKLMLVIFGFLLLTFGNFIPIDYVVAEASATGMSANLSQYLLAMLNAASLFGRLGAGAAADRFGAYNIFMLACYVSAILVLGLWIPASSNAANIVFATIFGFTSGAYVSLIAALVAKISPLSQIGYRTGLVFLFGSIGGLTTSPIAGAILQNSGGSYLGMKIFSGVCFIAGTTLILAARVRATGLKLFANF